MAYLDYNGLQRFKANLDAQTNGLIAPVYDSTKTYDVGDYVIYNNDLYRCTTAITTAEAWTAAHWTAAVLCDDVADLKNSLEASLRAVPATVPLNKFDIKVFDADIGFSPQGIAVKGNIAYVTNGYAGTPPINVVTEINLATGSYITHAITGLANGMNSLTIDGDGMLYGADHAVGGKFYKIDPSTWSVKATYDLSGSISRSNLAYDPINDVFYTCDIVAGIIYTISKDFNSVTPSFNIDVTSDKFPVHNPGTRQGFGYDGKYFYVPMSEVEAIAGNSFIFVYDKNGELVKRIPAFHAEIEELSYDFSTGKYYCTYATSHTGFIAQYVDDTGWLSLYDYMSGSYGSAVSPDNIDSTKTDAMFRVYNGFVEFRGQIMVNSMASGMTNVATYIDARVAPATDSTLVVFVTSESTGASPTFSNPSITVARFPFMNQYVNKFKQPFLPLFCRLTGSIHLDGVALPYGLSN